MIWLFKYIEDLIGKGLDLNVILELIGYASVNQFPMALPLSVLLSSIMTLGNLGESNELTAAKSLGVSLQSLIKPLMVFSIILSFFAFFTMNNIIPVTTLKSRTLLRDIHKKSPELNIPEGIFYPIDKYNIYVKKKGVDGTLYDIILHDHSTELKNNNVTVSKSGMIVAGPNKQSLQVTLWDGENLSEENHQNGDRLRTYPMVRNQFKEQVFTIELENTKLERSDGAVYKNDARIMNYLQLSHNIDSLKQMKYERQDKFVKKTNDTYFFKNDSTELYSQIEAKHYNINSILDTLDANIALNIISNATQLARGAKSYVSNVEHFHYTRNYYIKRYNVEFHNKFTLAVSCFVLFFIGAPFGAITRKGGLAWPIVYSVILFVLYWVLNITFQKLAKNGGFPMIPGMWMSNIILFPIGIYLTSRATKDLPLIGFTRKKRRKKSEKHESSSNL
jgi:lipopolysaccharide export system permease protein